MAAKKSSKTSKVAAAVKRAGVSGVNKPKRTPNHPTKSHVVVAKEGDTVKTVRFGQQGVKKKQSGKVESFRARHKCDSKPSKLSARYWSCRNW
jgi:predicted Zn-dependent protease